MKTELNSCIDVKFSIISGVMKTYANYAKIFKHNTQVVTFSRQNSKTFDISYVGFLPQTVAKLQRSKIVGIFLANLIYATQ